MGCATSARSGVFEKGASKIGSLMLNGFFSVPSLMMARRLANRRYQKRWSKDVLPSTHGEIDDEVHSLYRTILDAIVHYHSGLTE
ncbi:msr9518 (plasmid) [Mesorhizobium japonicum MAFF 303099]|uniref:Msr9518 protein n=1 Tax=Mesorhizobium japonicum (strain LMG 29417 / CECT 9101 / MAFF 303099) TaxID=266835 RepID=Q98PC5_RHILO|nr:msr9518 [Mesorhizobium japonicum MAFF 303099]